MRVAYVTATFPPYRGGTGNVCFYNAREMARRGHEVHVFTATVPGAPREERIENCLIHRLPVWTRVGNAPLLRGLFGSLRGFDLIHVHYPFIFGAEIARAASVAWRTPLVTSFHNDLIGDGARAPLFSMYQRVSAFFSIRGIAQLCVVSQDHYESSRLARSLGRGSVPVTELPNGVDIEEFSRSGDRADLRARFGVPPEARVVLFVAALDRAHHFKGLDRLLHSFEYIPDDVWLLVIGDGDLRAEYESQARRLGVTGRTVFAGALDHSALPPIFRSVDVTVLPSSPPESFGLVLIESLACGTPVVASRIAGVRTVVEDDVDGFLVDASRPEKLADAILDVLRDEDRRIMMGVCGRLKVERRYAWEPIGALLESVYEQAVSGSHRRLEPSLSERP